MPPLKAQVHNRRLVLDVPTDLPEGEVVLLVPIADPSMTEEERTALHDSLRESIEQMNAGRLIDADVALTELRAHE